jgi:homogentisate phytyltransferase/homogentisate geranylgeranyltransferase
MKLPLVIWKFSRPHTIIGSVISITTLYLYAHQSTEVINVSLLLLSLVVGITCNVFIVGINQVQDVEIDKINKPYLPIPAGILTLQLAKRIVGISLFFSLSFALYISPYLFGIVALSTFIGWAYSMPPFYLKKHHVTAALAISTVRGVLLNAGGFLVFNYVLNGVVAMPHDIRILTLFVIAFSIVISWFKDLSDMEGDSKFNIKTLALTFSPKQVLIAGNILVGLAYVFSILSSIKEGILFYGHILLLLLFLLNTLSINLNLHTSIKKYYQRFWWFFFAEYLLYLLAFVLR